MVERPETKYWSEPGSRKDNQEFKLWLHLRWSNNAGFSDNPADSTIYPWVFAEPCLDHSKLLAYYQVCKFKTWPGAWPTMKEWVQFHFLRHLDWMLHPMVHPIMEHPSFHSVPKEFLSALIRSE